MSSQTISSPQAFAENERDMALAWLKFTIEHFQANLERLRIGATHELRDSFHGALVSAAGNDELKLRLAYAIQGLYVDLGLSRGMAAGVTKAGGRDERGRDYHELRNSPAASCIATRAGPSAGTASSLLLTPGVWPSSILIWWVTP